MRVATYCRLLEGPFLRRMVTGSWNGLTWGFATLGCAMRNRDALTFA